MVESLLTLLVFQLIGEAIAHATHLPLPGPVIGMALLFLAWPALPRLHARLQQTADALLGHFGLLFVPAGVGVMVHAHLLAQWWGPLLLAVVVSTAGTMTVGALLFKWLGRRP